MRKEKKVMYTAPFVNVIDLETEESILAGSPGNGGTAGGEGSTPVPTNSSKRSIWEGEGIWK